MEAMRIPLAHQHPAKGHNCCLNRFDTDTVSVPFTEVELYRLQSAFKRHIDRLEATKDFPEKEEYYATYHNLLTAYWMVTQKGEQ